MKQRVFKYQERVIKGKIMDATKHNNNENGVLAVIRMEEFQISIYNLYGSDD